MPHAFQNPFILLLLVLAVLSLRTEDSGAATIIAVMVLVSALLRFVQEHRSGRAAARLQATVSTTATVSRPGPRADVPAGTADARDHGGRGGHPVHGLGAMVGLAPLPGSYFPWLGAALLGYCALTQGVRVWYRRRFGMWL
jgi:hypothetical protein